jgi:hypothetical protein
MVALRRRSPASPDIPTVSEFVQDYGATAWFGMIGRGVHPDGIGNIRQRHFEIRVDDDKFVLLILFFWRR